MTLQGIPPESDPGAVSGMQKGIVSRLARVQSTRVVFLVIGGSVLVAAALLLIMVIHIGPQNNFVIQGLQSLAGYDSKAPFGYERINPVKGKCPKGYRMDAKRKCIRPLPGPAITPTPVVTATPAPSNGAQKIAIAGATGSSVGGYSSSYAIDGNVHTMWNSGGFAPQTITLDLGNYYTVSSVRFNVQKTPAGTASHTITAGPCSQAYSYTQSFSENGKSGEWQEVSTIFGGAVRYVTISTTASPSWVAWAEIEAYGTPAVYSAGCSSANGLGAGDGGVGGGTGCLGGAVTLSAQRIEVGGTVQAYSTLGNVAVTYSSQNTSVASVSQANVTGVAAGTTSVTGRYVYAGRTCYLTAADITVASAAPRITGIQGYHAGTREYTNGTAPAGEYVILYGNFASSGNTVIATGTSADITFERADQINVRIGMNQGLATFTVKNSAGTSNTQSIRIVAGPVPTPTPVLTPTPTPTPAPTPIPTAAPPILTGVQGYDSVTATYGSQAVAGEFVVLYGSFAPSGNTVIASGTSANITFERADQINVRIGNTIGTVSFSVQNAHGVTVSRSIVVGARQAPFITPTPTPIPSAPVITGIQGYDATTATYNNTEAVAGQYVVLYGNFSPNNDNTVNIGSISAQNANQINVRIGSAVGVLTFIVTNPHGSSNPKSIQVVSAAPTPTPTPTPSPSVAVYTLNAALLDPTACPANNDTALLYATGSVSQAASGALVFGDGVVISRDGAVVFQAGFIETTSGTYVTNAGSSSYHTTVAGTYSVTLRFAGQYRTSRQMVVFEDCPPVPIAAGSISASPNPIVIASGVVGATTVTGRNTGTVNLILDVDGVSYMLLPSSSRQVIAIVPVGTSKLYRLFGDGFSQTIVVSAAAATP